QPPPEPTCPRQHSILPPPHRHLLGSSRWSAVAQAGAQRPDPDRQAYLTPPRLANRRVVPGERGVEILRGLEYWLTPATSSPRATSSSVARSPQPPRPPILPSRPAGGALPLL